MRLTKVVFRWIYW